MNTNDKPVFWWLAINGASCAASPMALPDDVVVRPTPERLLGYGTQAEQLEDQHRFLHHPAKSVRNYVRQLLPMKVRAGEIKQIIMQEPERPTAETQWVVGNDDADEDRETLPGGEMLAIAQPLTTAGLDQIRQCVHDWVVYSTALTEVWLMLECVLCGAHGSVDDPSQEEWDAGFYAPSNPFRWDAKSRVTIRGRLPDDFRHIVPSRVTERKGTK